MLSESANLNAGGDMVGAYIDAAGKTHGLHRGMGARAIATQSNVGCPRVMPTGGIFHRPVIPLSKKPQARAREK